MNPPITIVLIGLSCGAGQCGLAKKTRQLTVVENVQWPVVLVFESFPEGIMITEYAQIRILTLPLNSPTMSENQCTTGDHNFE